MTAKHPARGAGSRLAARAIALAALLTLMFAAGADAAGVRVEIDPDLTDFHWVVGLGPTPTITIHNDTDSELTLTEFAATQPPGMTFSAGQVDDCSPLPARGQCVLDPDLSIAGRTSTESGTWQISFTAPGGTEVKADPIPYSITSHVFAVTPRSLSANPQTVGTVGAAVNVTAEVPSGSLDTTFAQASLAGANPDDFLITRDGCVGLQVSPATCTIAVRFFPQAAGRRTATLVLAGTYKNTNTPDQESDSWNIPLEGTALAPAVAGTATQVIQLIPGPQVAQIIQVPQSIPAAQMAPTAPVCRSVTAAKIVCKGLSPSTGTAAKLARVDLRRGRTAYATGKSGTLKVLRRAQPGRYTLVILRRTRSGKIHKAIWRVTIG